MNSYKSKREQLCTLAEEYRNAIENALYERVIPYHYLNSFPTGCCDCASSLLQMFLREHGIETRTVSGYYEREDFYHTWLETREGIVIDITIDQFKQFKGFHFGKVFVGMRDDDFYKGFSNIRVDEGCCESVIQTKNAEIHRAILNNMENLV